MKETTERMKRWLVRMEAVTRRVKAKYVINLEIANDGALLTFERMMAPGFMESVMQAFINTQIVGEGGALNTLFHKYDKNHDYIPRFQTRYGDQRGTLFNDGTAKLRTVDGAEEEQVNSTAMFTALWNVLKQTKVWRSGNVIYGGVGPLGALRNLELNPYMPVQGHSMHVGQFNSLFLAVEYGTGIAKNVGGPRWVRRDGATKSQHEGTPGAWYISRESGKGAKMLGQKGLHFLDDERTRMPLPIYGQRLQQNFPRILQQRLNMHSLQMMGITTRRFGTTAASTSRYTRAAR